MFDRNLTEKEEVTDLIKKAWQQDNHSSTIPKLDLCRRKIIEWLKENHKNTTAEIKQNQEKLEQALSASIPDSPLIASLSAKLELAYKEEESFWKQRSRINWLHSGDRNTSFFHAVTRGRRALNSFSVIEDEMGIEFVEEDQIANTFSQVFQGIFTTNGNSEFQLIDEILQPKITEAMNESLIAIPSLLEIKEAVLAINPSKAPGPDGFSSKFYQAYWPTIGIDVSREIRSFF